MTFAVLRIRLVACQNVFCCARSLSGQARNRTWNLPSPSANPLASDVLDSPSQRARPSPQAPRKKSKSSRDTHVKASAQSRQSPKVPLRDNIRHVAVKYTKQTQYTPRNNSAAKPITPKPDAPWAVHKAAVKAKYPEGWSPGRKISPEAMEGIRILHRQRPQFTASQLGDFFKISPEAIRRILKSRWRPTAEEQISRIERWQRRRERIAAESTKRHTFRRQATTLQRHVGRFGNRDNLGSQFSRDSRMRLETFRLPNTLRRTDNLSTSRLPISRLSTSQRNFNESPSRPAGRTNSQQ